MITVRVVAQNYERWNLIPILNFGVKILTFLKSLTLTLKTNLENVVDFPEMSRRKLSEISELTILITVTTCQYYLLCVRMKTHTFDLFYQVKLTHKFERVTQWIETSVCSLSIHPSIFICSKNSNMTHHRAIIIELDHLTLIFVHELQTLNII